VQAAKLLDAMHVTSGNASLSRLAGLLIRIYGNRVRETGGASSTAGLMQDNQLAIFLLAIAKLLERTSKDGS
jgi:hypothetical protein